jgi:hypothetical protein
LLVPSEMERRKNTAFIAQAQSTPPAHIAADGVDAGGPGSLAAWWARAV